MLIYAAMAVVAAGREVKMGIQHSVATSACHIRALNQWIRNPKTHQLFAIIYLVIVKWKHEDHPQDFLTFLDGLGHQMRLHDISRTSTTIPLVWLFS
jgi:hypothetical protein